MVNKMRNSRLRFKDLFEDTGYIKVFWNGDLVYDDECVDTSIEDLYAFQNKYDSKIVYSFRATVVQFHHVILYIKGEKV
jgi:hypothetical protein